MSLIVKWHFVSVDAFTTLEQIKRLLVSGKSSVSSCLSQSTDRPTSNMEQQYPCIKCQQEVRPHQDAV